MQDVMDDLVNRLFTFLTDHFYEIVLIIMVLAILDIVFFILSMHKKDRVLILSAHSLPKRVFEALMRI